MLNLPQPAAPVTILPVGTRPDAFLHVYDGVPDAQPWAEEALSQARVCGVPLSVRGLEALCAEPLGAPFGPGQGRSLRVARATGVVVDDNAEGRLEGAAIAHGCLYATWRETEEGHVLEVEFQAPTCFGWGAGKDSLSQEQLMARCLRQYERQVVSLLEGVEDVHLSDAITLSFDGDWDESTELIRRRLAAVCVTRWAQLRTVPAPVAQLMAA